MIKYIIAFIIVFICGTYLYNKFQDNKNITDASIQLSPEISPSNILESETDSIEQKKSDSIIKVINARFDNSKAGKLYKKHSDWSKEDCEKLAERKIWIGMNYDMLLYLRGKPNNVNTSNYGSGNEYQCCWDDYDPSCFYMGSDHIITSYN